MPFRKELFSFTIAERFCMVLLETVSHSAVNITEYCSLPVRSSHSSLIGQSITYIKRNAVFTLRALTCTNYDLRKKSIVKSIA